MLNFWLEGTAKYIQNLKQGFEFGYCHSMSIIVLQQINMASSWLNFAWLEKVWFDMAAIYRSVTGSYKTRNGTERNGTN